MKSLRHLTLFFVLCMAVSAHAQLLVYSYSGTTEGRPTWNRPVANGLAAPTGLSGTGTAVSFSTFQFSVDTAGSYSFLSEAEAGWDNYLFLYASPFSEVAPLTSVLIANDDLLGVIGRAGFTTTLSSGTAYTLVTSGFENTDSGAFANTITGAGQVTAIPEPSTYAALLGVAALGIALWRRHRAA